MRLVLTGASGFIGRAVIAAAPADVDVIGCTREGAPPAPALPAPIGDISGSIDWAAVLAGADTVVHLAARVHVMRETSGASAVEFQRVNVHGTRKLADAAAAAGVKRFVFLSSVKVHGEGSGGLLAPDSPRTPSDPYGASKAAAEDVLSDVAARSGMNVVILRPPLVYGAGVRANFLALLRLVDRGIPLPLGSIRNRRSLIYVGNLAEAILAAARSEIRGVHAVLVSDGSAVSTPDLIRTIAAALGRRPVLLPVPVAALRLLAGVVGRSAFISRLVDSLEVDDSTARHRLGWAPSVTFRDGIAATVDWYRRGHRT
jgi:nucleoside-diphosphate-sugar epimerase